MQKGSYYGKTCLISGVPTNPQTVKFDIRISFFLHCLVQIHQAFRFWSPPYIHWANTVPDLITPSKRKLPLHRFTIVFLVQTAMCSMQKCCIAAQLLAVQTSTF